MPSRVLSRTCIVLAAALVLTACGEDEPEVMPATEEEYVDAVVEVGDAPIGDDEELTRCVWAAIVNTVGFERIVEADVTPSELLETPLADNDLDVDDDAAADLTTTVDRCGDLVDGFLVGAEEDVQDCVRERVSDALFAEALVEVFRGNDAPEDFDTAAEECAPD